MSADSGETIYLYNRYNSGSGAIHVQPDVNDYYIYIIIITILIYAIVLG